MPLYDYACACGNRFEALVPFVALAEAADSPAPPCPACGGAPRRMLPSRVALLGRATPPPARGRAPTSWEQTNGGDRETILHWQHTLEQRQKLEDKYPELAGDSRPVLAHEGPFAAEPLRADDPHSHPHSHSHRGRPA